VNNIGGIRICSVLDIWKLIDGLREVVNMLILTPCHFPQTR